MGLNLKRLGLGDLSDDGHRGLRRTNGGGANPLTGGVTHR
jgi:hypothetical protein